MRSHTSADTSSSHPAAQALDYNQILAIVRRCNRRMGSAIPESELEDVTQEVALVLWQGAPRMQQVVSSGAWLFGAARLEILAHLRKERRRSDLRLQLLSELEGPAEGEPSRAPEYAVDSWLPAALADLRSEDRTLARIVKRRGVDEWSFRRIGEELSCSAATVKSRYYRALPRLRRKLEEQCASPRRA